MPPPSSPPKQAPAHARPLDLLAENLPRGGKVDDGVPDPLQREHDGGGDVEPVGRLVRVEERVDAVDGGRGPGHEHRDGEDERRAEVRQLDGVHVPEAGAEAPRAVGEAAEEVEAGQDGVEDLAVAVAALVLVLVLVVGTESITGVVLAG